VYAELGQQRMDRWHGRRRTINRTLLNKRIHLLRRFFQE